KFTPYQEGALVRPEAALDVGTQVRISAPRPRTHLVMGAEGQRTWIVDRLVALPADHHRLLAVVLAALGDATEALEGLHVSRHQRVDVVALVGLVVLALAVREDVRKHLDLQSTAIEQPQLVRRPIALGHLPRPPIRRL